MAKREAIRQRLKAAQRRRQRRQAATSPSESSNSSKSSAGRQESAQVDVAGLIVQTILDHAHSLGNSARDVIVVAAIQSFLRGTTPSGDDAKELATRLSQIPQRPGISLRSFRDSLQQLLAMSNSHRDPRSGDAFLRYLAMLAE
jgi:hypothetical protein